jgi:hypothetical protein
MPERETLYPEMDVCALSERWGISEDLSRRLLLSVRDYLDETRGTVTLISGFRTAAQQKSLGRSGRPTAPDELSTHRSCPATGADVSLGFAPVRIQKAIWGRVAIMNGLRWGGGGKIDSGGMPLDWGHVDLGPRTT